MKATLDIADSLLLRAKRHAKKTGRPLRAVVEEGLRLVLLEESRREAYRLPDRSVGTEGDPNPLDALSWPELRARTYGGDR